MKKPNTIDLIGWLILVPLLALLWSGVIQSIVYMWSQ